MADSTVDVAIASVHAAVTIAADALTLTVSRDGRTIVHASDLGLLISGEIAGPGSTVERWSVDDREEAMAARTGKRARPTVTVHRELMIDLRSAQGRAWQLIVRVAADGVAFRYALPGLEGTTRFERDLARIELPATGRAWVLDYQTWYETPRRAVDVPDIGAASLGFPMLVCDGDDAVLITEADIDGRFAGAHAAVADGELRFAIDDAEVELARGEATPWRAFVIGDLAAVVESTFVDELAPPTRAELLDATWIRPGRAAWSWWSDFYSGAQLREQQHFVDVAARLGWEHLLIDCGWEATWVPEIVAYASARGIQVHLWVVWHDLDGPGKLAALALWRSWGVAGIKVDFMESESKDRYRWYDTILAETARLGLMVNFHGSVIPRGWARTWPHVVSYEAIRGAEYYVFFEGTPLTSSHNVIQPFTRNVVGAMDYTPVAFGAPGRTTTDAHELALSVVFESGITHIAAHVDEVLDRPLAADFLERLAPRWDDTLLLGGTPDTEAIIARRAGGRWYLGAVATGMARTLHVPVHRLGLSAGSSAWIVTDGPDGALCERIEPLGGELVVDIAADGGFVAILATDDPRARITPPHAPAPHPFVSPQLAELVDGAATLDIAEGARLRVPPGWSAQPVGGSRWRVVAPALPDGALGVITVETAGDRGIPVVAHARLVAPLRPGVHRASRLPMVRFENALGPVERDQSNGGGNPDDGGRMRVADVPFDDGFGTSSPSSFDLAVLGRVALLEGLVGVDDESSGSAQVRVLADGVELLRLSVTAGESAVAFAVEVPPAQLLTFETAGDAASVHVDWAELRLTVPEPGAR